jgi:5-oxoprolinase (ATP-hydrolysing) subunit A
VKSPVAIDLNADVGEGFASDADLIPLVSSVNIACGAHAGDRETMRLTVALAKKHGAAIGAHPGFADPAHFGRRELLVTPGEAAALVIEQTGLLESVAAGLGARVGHIKLHGALYNMVSRDRGLATAVAAALSGSPGRGWLLVALAGSELASVARARGLRVREEAFADRAYRSDGTLAPRTDRGAVIEDEERAAHQAVRLAREGRVRASDGADICVTAETLCIHGDSPRAVAFARRIRADLSAAGIVIRS